MTSISLNTQTNYKLRTNYTRNTAGNIQTDYKLQTNYTIFKIQPNDKLQTNYIIFQDTD